jgi:putative ABC transport system permease protein
MVDGMAGSGLVSGTVLRWMIAGEWKAYPARVILAALAIAIGVALGFAVHLINASALTEFDRAIRTVNGDADLQVRATSQQGFDERLYPRLAHLPGLAGVSPAVELQAQAGERTPITLVGLDMLRAAAVTPNLLGKGSTNPFDDKALYLSPAALRASGYRVGDAIVVTAAGRSVPLTIAGELPGTPGDQRIGVVDIAAAQWRFGQLGRLQRIDLRLVENADPAQVSAAIAAILPSGAEIASRQSEERRSDSLSRAYRVNLDMLALVALLTGGFLVYSAQSLSVARRRPQFALLRVLGMNRRALLTQILAEALAVGGLGALAGLGLGLGLAAAALRFLGGDLGGGYFRAASLHLSAAPGAAATFGALGLAAALVGSLLPAHEAGGAVPAVALKNMGDAIDPSSRPQVWPALTLLAAGAAAAFAPAVQGLPILGYLSIALLLAGGVAAMPWLARMLLSPLHAAAIASPTIGLAVRRLWGAPSQAAIALCGIVASTSLMIAMAVMVTSFRGSVEEWLVQILPADLYLTLDDAASGPGLDAATQARLSALPNVEWIGFLKETPLRLTPDRPPVSLVARTIGGPAGGLPLLGESLPVPAGQTPVWVSEPAARLYGYRPGDRIVLPIAGVASRVFVAGVWRDYARQHGAIAIDGAAYTRLSGDAERTSASIAVTPGSSEDAVARSVQAALRPAIATHATIAKPREIRARALAVFDRSFAITYLLEAIAIIVGLAGVAATISAQTLARTKEFGMLRHVGVRRIQVSGMLATEGALMGAIGGVAGIGLGLAMSQVLIHVVNPQSFHWTMETRLPWALLAAVASVLVIAAAGAALLAGRRALSTDAIRAVREDW